MRSVGGMSESGLSSLGGGTVSPREELHGKRVKRAPGSGRVGRGKGKADREARAPKTEKPLGRVDASGQEAVINHAEALDRMPVLESLCRAVNTAKVEFNDAVKMAAEKSGLLASTVRRIVIARVGDNFEDKRRAAAQLSLAFDELGE